MTARRFEELLTQWRATPDDPVLVRRLDAALRRHPQFRNHAADFLLDDRVLRAGCDSQPCVRWIAFRRKLRECIRRDHIERSPAEHRTNDAAMSATRLPPRANPRWYVWVVATLLLMLVITGWLRFGGDRPRSGRQTASAPASAAGYLVRP